MKTINIMNKYQQQIVDLYLDYVNNFLTLGGFADYYGYSIIYAEALINEGRDLRNGMEV